MAAKSITDVVTGGKTIEISRSEYEDLVRDSQILADITRMIEMIQFCSINSIAAVVGCSVFGEKAIEEGEE